MKMEEFQNMIHEHEFEGESILEDFDDFGTDKYFTSAYTYVVCKCGV